MISAAFKRILRISVLLVFFHDFQARWHESTAFWASSTDADEQLYSFFSVLGELTSKVVSVTTSLPSSQRGL